MLPLRIGVLQLAELAGLSEPDKLALGNWIDKGVGTGQTPARYSATRPRRSIR